ncbi:ABSCISIC ACID-INSENSITIVE 5-like protein 2 [Mangifera indica]|uniref:ABSCISIC ACID-INSENSITIVE 5-like protein 2 n=1 Tax=Mangifera indica TaxID=29780 RepID=UPI001CFA3D2B|nr:ABSCISIC ACID-INSENSITIVE 5-like protein 2 [Mangifera indica]
MGIQTMGSQSNGQQSHLQPSRQNSWYNLTLNEVENQLGILEKPLGSMNMDELLKNVWTSESDEIENTSSPSCLQQRQTSMMLARALSGKTVDQVWKEIQQGYEKRFGRQREPSLGEVTLEDFLIQAATVSPSMELDSPQPMAMTPSIPTLSNTITPTRKREADANAIEKSIERRLRRKIKNRESAARSRARKQAYHNELVSKVSRLEESNIKLKKEKEFDNMLGSESLNQPKCQLRRTSSSLF